MKRRVTVRRFCGGLRVECLQHVHHVATAQGADDGSEHILTGLGPSPRGTFSLFLMARLAPVVGQKQVDVCGERAVLSWYRVPTLLLKPLDDDDDDRARDGLPVGTSSSPRPLISLSSTAGCRAPNSRESPKLSRLNCSRN